MMSKDTVLVIGSEGFLGRHVVSLLLNEPNLNIRGMDLSKSSIWDDRIEYISGDMNNLNLVRQACKNVTSVFLIASPHYNASDELLFRVNVVGVSLVLQICKEYQVKKLVYTGSAMAYFEGASANYIDESFSPTEFINEYARSKHLGELQVLKANCTELRTCSLRLYALIGPGDSQIAPALVESHQLGLSGIGIGNNTNLVDFTSVQNAAEAHILAMRQLDKEDVHGQAFFITNGTPIPFFQYCRKFLTHRGIKDSYTWFIPASIAYIIAIILTPLFLNFLPFKWSLTPLAVLSSTNEVYFNISKAKKVLGYQPKVSLDEAIRGSAKLFN